MSLELPVSLALGLTQRLLGVGLLIQGWEGLVTRQAYGRAGAWVWAGPAGEGVWHRAVGEEGVGLVFLVRILASGWLLLPGAQPVSPGTAVAQAVLLGTSVLLTLRTRGPLCGGSDSMFFQVQLGLGVASLGMFHPALPVAGLAWIAAQSVLSYFLSGVGKLRHVRWRNGSALQNLLSSDGPYIIHAEARRLASSRRACAVLGWGMMLFQVIFPLVLVLPGEARWVLLALGFLFHLGNAVTLGLNRFLWAWLPTYPALLHFGARPG